VRTSLLLECRRLAVQMAHSTDDLLTADRFARLLAKLDSDPNRAAHEYERLRQALVRMFDWRGTLSPEECADETLDRLARRLDDEPVVQHIASYAHGIARMILLERRRQPVPLTLGDVQEIPELVAPPRDEEADRIHACFDGCLSALSSEHRTLLLQYYEGEQQTKIGNRRDLAKTLGVSDSALRSRVQRLRNGMERCIERCLASKTEGRRDS
jgi:DNA-directed RNA polymerase specialized sigma24 family protein